MNKRSLMLAGVLAVLGLLYIVLFTEWIKPEPIQIASQVRASVQRPRFGRNVTQRNMTNLPTAKGDIMIVRTNLIVRTNEAQRVRLPDWGEIDQAPGGVANVTFSFDGAYRLTALRVQDVPADGSPPRVVWQLAGKSLLTSSLLYGRDPQGMKPVLPGTKAEVLTAGVPYRLIIEAGRRRGTNSFTTIPSPAR
jgi:hypothetical protein